MAEAQTAPAKMRSRVKRRRVVRRSDGTFVKKAYAVDIEELVKRGAPAGVKVTLVPSNAAAEKSLKQWGPTLRNTGRIVEIRGKTAPAAKAIEAKAFEPDARSRALLRGVEIARTDLEAAGGAFDLEEVRTLLHEVTRQRIEKRVKEGTLLAVPGPSNRRRYPTFQFMRGGEVVGGLKEVQEALPTRNPWAVLNFFVQPDDRLGGRKPIDVLKAGDVELVVSAARGMARQGG